MRIHMGSVNGGVLRVTHVFFMPGDRDSIYTSRPVGVALTLAARLTPLNTTAVMRQHAE